MAVANYIANGRLSIPQEPALQGGFVVEVRAHAAHTSNLRSLRPPCLDILVNAPATAVSRYIATAPLAWSPCQVHFRARLRGSFHLLSGARLCQTLPQQPALGELMNCPLYTCQRMHAKRGARQRLTAPCTCPAQVQLRVRVPKPGGKDLKSCAVPVHLPPAGTCRDAAGYEGQTHCQELALVLKADGRTVEAKVRSALGPCIWTERQRLC